MNTTLVPVSARQRERTWTITAGVFLLAIAAAAATVLRIEQGHIELARVRASDQASDHADALGAEIFSTMSATMALELMVREARGTIPDIGRVGPDLVKSFPRAIAFQLAPGGVVSRVVPLEGNEVTLGTNLLEDPQRRREALAAKDSGAFTLAGPFRLRQGGEGIVGRRPVFLEDDTGNRYFWGFTIVVMRLGDTKETVRLAALADSGYDYRLWRVEGDAAGRTLIAGSADTPLDDPVEREVRLPGARWVLGIAPRDGWVDYPGLAAKLALGLALSVLLAMVTKLLLELRAHQSGLEALVERRTAEVESREADLNRAQSIARVGSWVWDPAEQRLRWSAQAREMISAAGREPPEDLEALLGHVHPDDRVLVRRRLKAAFAGESVDFEHRVVLGEDVRWIRQRSAPERGPDGHVARVAGTFQEITERKRAQEALLAAEARYRGLVENSLAGIYVLQDGRFVYVNPRFAEILGYGAPADLQGVDPFATAPESEHATMREHRRRLLEGEAGKFHYTRAAIRRDGTGIVLDVTGTLAAHEGRPAIIGTVMDVSEMARAEAEIRRHLAQLEAAIMSTVEMATMMGEMRDPYTAGHQRRVAAIAVAIGERMGFDAGRREGLRVAGYLHDIGKITIPAEILSKPGRLSAIEYSLVKNHSQASYDVLRNVDFPWPVAEIALQHHERLDGSGYPRGLKGEEILPEARILAVADVVEAMSTHRPYRASLGIDKALAEIERGRGTAYDPAVVDACLALFREGGFAIPD